jgi:hypothetical protein
LIEIIQVEQALKLRPIPKSQHKLKHIQIEMELARLILDILIILLGLWALFFKAYFTEKGKNFATKEDIQEITSKIESVKLEFLKKLESNNYALALNRQLLTL